MTNLISVGELRQNPTRMLREVKQGATYVITDHGEPVAEIAPRQAPRWLPASELSALLRELGADEAWAADLDEARSSEHPRDPWERGA